MKLNCRSFLCKGLILFYLCKHGEICYDDIVYNEWEISNHDYKTPLSKHERCTYEQLLQRMLVPDVPAMLSWR